MLKLRKIAITGGVASGKSTVCQLFQKLGAYVVDADAIVHELLDPQTNLGQKIIRTLGPDVFRNGTFNRQAIAEIVFKNPELLRVLEKILHPEVLHKIDELYEQTCKLHQYSLFVVEIPLLFEIGAENSYDTTIAVVADDTIAKQRFCQKTGHTEQEYMRRMSRQISPFFKSAKAQYTIQNNGSLEQLQKEVHRLHDILLKRDNPHES